MPTSLQGIANKARSDKHHRFRNLFGLLNVAGASDLLGASRQESCQRRGSGSARTYAKDLAEQRHGTWWIG